MFVWSFDSGENIYKPEFVNVDEKLSIIDISWSNQGHKIIIGTSSKKMYMAYNDPADTQIDWNSTHIKGKFDSSIVSCCFDPSA